MQTCVAALRLPGRMNVEQVAGCWWAGWPDDVECAVYAYSFPELIKDNEPFAIKVGYTDCDVDARVRAQCKGASSFSHPVVLGSWKTDDAYRLEQFVHAYLKFHKRHRTRCSGTEWFDTTLAEIERVISFGLSQ